MLAEPAMVLSDRVSEMEVDLGELNFSNRHFFLHIFN